MPFLDGVDVGVQQPQLLGVVVAPRGQDEVVARQAEGALHGRVEGPVQHHVVGPRRLDQLRKLHGPRGVAPLALGALVETPGGGHNTPEGVTIHGVGAGPSTGGSQCPGLRGGGPVRLQALPPAPSNSRKQPAPPPDVGRRRGGGARDAARPILGCPRPARRSEGGARPPAASALTGSGVAGRGRGARIGKQSGSAGAEGEEPWEGGGA